MAVRFEYYIINDHLDHAIWTTDQMGGETFTPEISHKITSVKLLLYKVGNPGIFTVKIMSTEAGGGEPRPPVLCSGTSEGNTLPTAAPYELREISLGAGYDLETGTQYGIALQVGAGADAGNYINWRRYDKGVAPIPYSGGTYYYSGNALGTVWSKFETYDVGLFEEWGEVPKAAAGLNPAFAVLIS